MPAVMNERLFTYGSLQPGGQYAHLLSTAGDDWQPATVTGFIDPDGWGHSIGYPALILHADGVPIPGMLITSSTLHELWPELDDFEGNAYQRVITNVTLADGTLVPAFLYTLHENLQQPIRARLGISPVS